MERKRSTRRYRYRKKTWTQKCKDYFREFIAFMFSNVGIIGLVVGYTIAGAFVFQAIEGGEAPTANEDVIKLRNETAQKIWNLSCCAFNVFSEESWKNCVSTELEMYQEKIVEAIGNGYDGTDNIEESQQWTFSGAFLYSLTVITTIGYGNIAPHTEIGKVVTILYAIIGMPLFLLYLSNIGDILAKSFKWTYAKCCLCKGCCAESARRRALREQKRLAAAQGYGVEDWKVRHVVGEAEGEVHIERGGGEASVEAESIDSSVSDQEEYDPQTVTVPVTLCLAIMVGYVCFGAVLFSEWENWDFLDGSYFCFISLSTIGFGDIVPGEQVIAQEVLELSFIFCSMYLMLGMALIAMCFNLMQEEVVAKIRTCARRLRFIFSCRKWQRQRQIEEEEAYIAAQQEEQQQQQQQSQRPPGTARPGPIR